MRPEEGVLVEGEGGEWVCIQVGHKGGKKGRWSVISIFVFNKLSD